MTPELPGVGRRKPAGLRPCLWPVRLWPLLLLTLPGVVQARYNYTTNNGAITITGYSGSGAKVTIPSTINGLPVTSVGNSAFSGAGLTSVTIPDSVTNIGEYAFGGCWGLAGVTIGNSVTRIGDSAFNACWSLTSVTIPDSVISLGDNAFDHCLSLTDVTIGSNVASIGQSAFGCCHSLASVTIPNSVTNIGDRAFQSCSSLTSVYFQGDAPRVGSDVFNGNDEATVYYLPETTGGGVFFAERPSVLWTAQVQTTGTSLGLQTSQFGFTIAGTSNLVVVVEACTNLANPTWSPLQTITLSGTSFYFSDPQWMNYPTRFYRLRSP